MGNSNPPPKPIHPRHVLVIGEAGSGKSALANRFFRRNVMPEARSAQVVTAHANCLTFAVCENDQQHFVHWMDTRGLLKDAQDSLEVENAIRDIRNVLTKSVLSVHRVFILAKYGRMGLDYQLMCEEVANLIAQENTTTQCVMLLTHCDNFSPDRELQAKEEIIAHSYTKPLLPLLAEDNGDYRVYPISLLESAKNFERSMNMIQVLVFSAQNCVYVQDFFLSTPSA